MYDEIYSLDLNPDKLRHYLFTVSLDRFDRSYNTIDNPSGRICIWDKTEDDNLNKFNIKYE